MSPLQEVDLMRGDHIDGCNQQTCPGPGECNTPRGLLIAPSLGCVEGDHGECDSKGWDMANLKEVDYCPCVCHE